MCKFDVILKWECWGTEQAKKGKLELRNTKTVCFNVKIYIYIYPPKEDILRIKSVNMDIDSV